MNVRLHLIPDTRDLQHVGRLADGSGYWIDVQLARQQGDTRDFVASYVFDIDGNLTRHRIEDLGLRGKRRARSVAEVVRDHEAKLGERLCTFILRYGL